jgi:hypothetical protein
VKALEPLAVDDATREHGLGAMSLERWQTLVQQLEELELIKPGAVDAAAVMHSASDEKPSATH